MLLTAYCIRLTRIIASVPETEEIRRSLRPDRVTTMADHSRENCRRLFCPSSSLFFLIYGIRRSHDLRDHAHSRHSGYPSLGPAGSSTSYTCCSLPILMQFRSHKRESMVRIEELPVCGILCDQGRRRKQRSMWPMPESQGRREYRRSRHPMDSELRRRQVRREVHGSAPPFHSGLYSWAPPLDRISIILPLGRG